MKEIEGNVSGDTKKTIRKAIDLKKAVFNYVIKHDDFLVDDLFEAIEAQFKEKTIIYAYLRELSYIEFIQGIKHGETTRYIKVNL